MEDPKRLVDDGSASPELSRLLRSAHGDPGLGDSARAKIALLAKAPAASAGWSVPWRIVGLCMGLAALGGGIVATTAHRTPLVQVAALPAVPPPPPSTAIGTVPEPVQALPVATVAKPSPAPSAKAPTAAASSKGTLADEVKALDRVRAALARSDGAGAVAELDAYDRAFPHGLLAQEATVLRVEALLAEGDRTNAVRIGHAFLAKSPNSPYATRVRTLLGE